jgi:hypothetical protein
MNKQDASVQAILRSMGLPSEAETKEEIAIFHIHFTIVQLLRGIGACNLVQMRILLRNAPRPLFTDIYFFNDVSYRGNLLHHIVRDRFFHWTGQLLVIVAMLQSMGCDFYHQLDSNGDAACLLAARLMESTTFFHKVHQLTQSCIHLLIQDADLVPMIVQAGCRVELCDAHLIPYTIGVVQPLVKLCIIVINNENYNDWLMARIDLYTQCSERVVAIIVSSKPTEFSTVSNLSLIKLCNLEKKLIPSLVCDAICDAKTTSIVTSI